jgi:hypothetical protein
MNKTLVCLFLLAVAPGLLVAQSFTASIRGVVTDASSAAVPEAKVTATNAERNTSTSALTDTQGRYVITALQPGSYTLTVEARGFRRYSMSAFVLQVQQAATIDVRLELGEVSTTVEVEASAPLLNTTIANLGQVIENKYIMQMPLLGRSPMALLYLTPGITGSGGRLDQNNTNFVANGARNSTADVLLDGTTVTNVEQNSGITQLKYTPSVDAVQEFKVQTNFFSAEFGNTGGAVINMVTKSGTNALHGTAYEFYRNNNLNANSFFNNRAGRGLPSFSRHVFGGVVGGPIRKDRLFFFSTYERTQQDSATSAFSTFPTEQERAGDFSNYRTSSGQLITIYNPFDTYTNAAGDIKRRPFAGNMVPRSMHNPVALKALEFFPLPNQQGAAFTNQDNWFAQGVNQNRSNQMDNKMDWNMNATNRFSLRHSFNWGKGDPANLFGNSANRFNTGPGTNDTHNVVGDFTRTHSANTIFQIRYGFLYQFGDRKHFEDFDATSLGLPPLIKQNADVAVFPRFAPEGYSPIGTEGWLVIGREESVNQVSGSVTRILRGHNLRFGGEYRKFQLDYLQPGYPQSQYSFNRQITREDRFAGSATQGNALASMLLGWGSGSSFHHDPWSNSYSAYYGAFVQDDWKITRKLTINLGLRYDVDIPRWEALNRLSYWNLDGPSPLNGKVPGYDLRGFYEFANDEIRSPFDRDSNNFQPRVGFAYALNDKTSIRSGYGLFYSLSRATIKGHLGSGYMSSSGVEWSRDSNATQYATLTNPFPNGLNLPTGNTLGPNTFIGLGAGTAVRENFNPEYHSWNFSIQRELPASAVLEVNYTGSRGTHLLMPLTTMSPLDPIYWGQGRTALNAQVPNPFFGVIADPKSSKSAPTVSRQSLLRPFPQYTGASRGDGSEPGRGNSYFHSVQFRYEKRFSHGLVALAHYTISKMLDDVSHGAGNLNWLGGNTNLQDINNLRNEKSVSAHDIPQRLVLSFSYELPVGRGKKLGGNMNRLANAVVGGWEVSGIATVQSGVPMHITQDAGVLWDATQRPNLIGDPSKPGPVQDKLDQYFNTAAFSRPTSDSLGTSPRLVDRYRAPGLRNIDMSMHKYFDVTETMRGEFRFETFNTTNTPFFAAPGNVAFGSTSFGRINGTAGGARQVQLGFKFYF